MLIIEEKADEVTPRLLDVTVRFAGYDTTHNMPCPCCLERNAVMHKGMNPCWFCQAEGYVLVQVKQSWKRTVLGWLTGEAFRDLRSLRETAEFLKVNDPM